MARPRSDIDVRILHAARAQFLSDGVEAASLRAIAKAAGTNIGMIYYYFPTKDDLFLAVVEEVYEGLLTKLAEALNGDVDVPARITRLYQRVGELDQTELDVLRLVVREALTSPARLERLFERFQRGHIPLLLRTAFDAMAQGTFDPRIHPMLLVVATMVIGVAPQLILRRFGDRLPPGLPAPPRGEELARTLVDMLLHGVSPSNLRAR